MSNTLLNSEDFGLKIYNRFPPAYREVDELNGFALKRYLQSIGEGGFKYSIEEINGILNLVNCGEVDASVLPFLYSQYGLEVFNGIPEDYLRYFLPLLSLAYTKKGSMGVIPFVASSLSGIRTDIQTSYDTYGNPKIAVLLEMDYQVGNYYFPNSAQFERILTNFLPFYATCDFVYSYIFHDTSKVYCGEKDSSSLSLVSKDEVISTHCNDEEAFNVVRNENEKGSIDKASYSNKQYGLVLNNPKSTLNNGILLNLDVVDRITYRDGGKTLAIPTDLEYIYLSL